MGKNGAGSPSFSDRPRKITEGSSMELRELAVKDAPLMLEWMHDASVVENLKKDFREKTLEDCVAFIMEANSDPENRHFAIVNDENEYMGTVSLKHIKERSAEFGIVVRTCAMGKGFSSFGMQKIIDYGFSVCGLNLIYWCVDRDNQRAIRFYDKLGFLRTANAPAQARGYSDAERQRYIWYSISSNP